MYRYIIMFFSVFLSIIYAKEDMNMSKKYNTLTPQEQEVIIHKATEPPYSGKYNNFYEKGTFICKRCDAKLYRSEDKFSSNCGWPSFDDEIKGAIKRVLDKDGKRIEIVCANCGAHLGHVFEGEGFTPKNVRHCVNSISMKFIPDKKQTTKKAYFAGGCFWGVEYYFQKYKGVLSAISGFMGGDFENPSYEDVIYKNTGHVEVVEVNYDESKVSYEELAKLFFEIHDPTQTNGQGPDIGDQYLSVAFYNDEKEKQTIEKLIEILKSKGYKIATKVKKATKFYKAEEYHQDYYFKNGKIPYCHTYTKRF